jgi:hypothetical protein
VTDQTAKNNDLIDRYIAAVGRHLPAKTSADITAELREAVSFKLEEKERALGRTAEKNELAEIIKSFGSPMLAAGRYSGHQYLLGPDIFPYYWPVARIVVGIVAAVAMVGFLVQGVLSDTPLLFALKGVGAAWNGAIWSFGIVTGIFIGLDRGKAGASIEKSWHPESLPAYTRDKPKSLFESLFSLAWDVLFIGWWVGFLHIPNTLPGTPGRDGITLDFDPAIWSAIFWLVLAMAVMSAATHVADVVHPTWTRLRGFVSIIGHSIGLSALWIVARSPQQLFAVHGAADPDVAGRVAQLNQAFATVSQVTIYGLAIGFGIALAVEVWKLVRSFPAGAPGLDAARKG